MHASNNILIRVFKLGITPFNSFSLGFTPLEKNYNLYKKNHASSYFVEGEASL
jgi:hypothetical protein